MQFQTINDDWEKTFAMDKELISLYKELQMNTKMTFRPIEKQAKDMNLLFIGEEIQVVFKLKSRSSDSGIIREMQI